MRSLPKASLAFATLLLGAGFLVHAKAPAEQPQPLLFFVATTGSDQNPGTRDKPFATPEAARDAIRALKRRHADLLLRPVTVLLQGGTYFLRAPLVLTPQDSGTANCQIIYAAFPGARPVLSGGRRITGWKKETVAGKPLWVADLPEVRAGKWYPHQLWVNGQRRPRARYPKKGFLNIAGLPRTVERNGRPQGNNQFQFSPGDIKAWKNLEDVEVVALHLWVAVRLRVAAVDEAKHTVTFSGRSGRPLMDGNEPARYYVENAFELLDSPGEWYLNRQTGKLYYWPLPADSLDDFEVVAPVLPRLVELAGEPEKGRPVSHVTFRGLTFAHAEWWPGPSNPMDVQAAAPVPGAVRGEGVQSCAFENCTVAHVSNYALELGKGCQNNRVARCDLFDLGAGGVKIGEMAVRDQPALQAHDNQVTDCHIHQAGRIFHQGVGVWVGQSFKNRVAHNHIHDLYYTGISCGWTWGYGKSLAQGNVFEFNHVHDLGQNWLSDMGGIYTLGDQEGTVVRSNVFHDISGHKYGGWGIYFDEGTTHIRAENNLVYRTTHGGFHQHYGKENTVRNNIFALGRDAQIQRTRLESHRSFTFERNIVYWKTGQLLTGNWERPNVVMDYNLYWCEGDGPIRFGKRSWKEWQAEGMDKHSLIADPLFVGPEKDDFRLKDGSPAFKLGFVRLDLSGVGPRPVSAKAASR